MGDIESKAQFDDTPSGHARRWSVEFTAAKKKLADFHRRGDKAVDRFKDKRETADIEDSKLNLFSSDVLMKKNIIYGRTPEVSAMRRFEDASDDVARVGGEILERLMNTDIERDSDSYATALSYALMDWLLPGFGNCRLRYVAKMGKRHVEAQLSEPDPVTGQQAELAPAYDEDFKESECVETDYVPWKRQLWGAGATFHEIPWWAFEVEMTRDQLNGKFGEDVGQKIPLKGREGWDKNTEDPWSRASVWEIWDKDNRCVWWYCEGYPTTLAPVGLEVGENGGLPDPLQLEGFWPFERPLAANMTTEDYVPIPDYYLAQDLYGEIDQLTLRRSLLIRALRVAGVYDKTSTGLQRLLSETKENQLIPVDNWAAFAEKGGVKGVVDWLPVEQIANVLAVVGQQREETIQLLYQITGMSDLMRGASQQGATATEQAIKARFASTRVKAMQDEFARFASGLQRIKGEIIARHYDPETIVKQSNVMNTPDAQLAQQAVELIKSDPCGYRIQVKPESVALEDMAAIKSERLEFAQAISVMFQQMIPMMQAAPQLAPLFLENVRYVAAGFKGSDAMESVLDRTIDQVVQQNNEPKQQEPNPQAEVAQMKIQGDMAKVQAETQADLIRTHAETQSEIQKQAAQAHFNIREMEAQERTKALQAVNNVGGQQ